MLKTIFFLLMIIMQSGKAYEFTTNNIKHADNKFFSNNKVISAEQAFKFVATKQENKIKLDITIAPNCYLYKDKLNITNTQNQQDIIANYPPATIIIDEFTQENVEIYNTSFTVYTAVNSKMKSLTVSYQGCLANTLCYPPQSIIIDLPSTASNYDTLNSAQPTAINLEKQFSYFDILTKSSFIVSLFIFFLAGIALCFTPCVFPMLPIICSLVIKNATTKRLQSLNLAFLYIIGMSLVMAVAGIITALLGSSFNLQLHMQSAWLLIPIAIMFIILAISMFGVFEIKMPVALQQKLNIEQGYSGNKYVYAFLMGAISALVVSPCVTPPLVGALLYISSTSDIVLGGSCLFALGLGMGLPMLIITIGGKSLLPKSGAWMLVVRMFFAVTLILIADMLLARIFQQDILYLIHVFLIVLSVFLIYKCTIPYVSKKVARLLKTSNYVALFSGVVASLIIISPLIFINNIDDGTRQATIDSPVELTKTLNKFKKQQLPVMVFFSANWCSVCHTLEDDFMHSTEIASVMENLGYVKFDITKLTTQHYNLLKSFNIFGPPAILFFDNQGNELSQLRVVHSITVDELAHRIDTVLKLNNN